MLILLFISFGFGIDCSSTDHDGWFCGFNKVQLCVAKQELTQYSCGGQGCVQSKCYYNIGFCQGRLNQWYCDNRNVQLQLQCQNGEQNPVAFNLCSTGQQCSTLGSGVTCINQTSSTSSKILISYTLGIIFIFVIFF